MSCTVVRTLLRIHQHHLGDMKRKDKLEAAVTRALQTIRGEIDSGSEPRVGPSIPPGRLTFRACANLGAEFWQDLGLHLCAKWPVCS